MSDEDKTREQLLNEVVALRRRIAELEEEAAMKRTSPESTLNALRMAHEGLELQFRERAAQLEKMNEELRTEIAERRRAEERIVQQNTFLNHVLESLTHPFYVLDANDYTVKIANSAAAPKGLPPHTACYALTHRRSTPCDSTEHLCPLRAIKETKMPFTVEHVHYDRDGNPRNVEVHGYPIFDNEGNVAQIIEYSFDITERKTMEQELRDNAEKIKLFAYSVSHDLKSPLIGINGLVRLLHSQYRDRFDEKGKKYCDQILRASEQVVALIEEINLFVRTKEVPLKFESIQPKKIISMVVDEFSAFLGARQINWLEPEYIPEIRADRMSLLRVFRNLVDNALKYGGEELSEIRFGYRESKAFHILSVTDNGVGVEAEEVEKIFELFQRNRTSRGIQGTGLGLAIVKEIAEKHAGRAWAKPRSDGGVTFYLSISKDL